MVNKKRKTSILNKQKYKHTKKQFIQLIIKHILRYIEFIEIKSLFTINQ